MDTPSLLSSEDGGLRGGRQDQPFEILQPDGGKQSPQIPDEPLTQPAVDSGASNVDPSDIQPVGPGGAIANVVMNINGALYKDCTVSGAIGTPL